MPLIFRMNIGTKAILLIVIYPPSSVNNNKLLKFGIKCLDTIVKQLYLCDKKGKKLKQEWFGLTLGYTEIYVYLLAG